MYRQDDIHALVTSLPKVVREASHLRNAHVEPTLNEQSHVHGIIREFIQKRRRLVYGGTALDVALRLNNASHYVYDRESPQQNDIEFFSFKAMEDVTELCDILHASGYRHVEAKLAIHDNTYTIHVNYQKYCDVTYMPSNVFMVLPYFVVDNVRYVHPEVMVIDYLRVLNDPMTSYFRVEKDFPRLCLLQQHLKPVVRPSAPPITHTPHGDDCVKWFQAILRYLSVASSCVAVGHLAKAGYTCLAQGTPWVVDLLRLPILECVSTEFTKDMLSLVSLSKDLFGDRVSYEEHHRFYDYWGHRGILCLDNTPMLIVYDNNHKSIPCIGSIPCTSHGEPMHVQLASFPYTVMMFLISRVWHATLKDADAIDDCMHHVCDLYDLRQAYFESYGVTAADDTPFREFVLTTVGTALTAMRIKALRTRAREKRGRPFVFKYVPTKEKPDYVTNFMFDNTSGNVIRNPRDRLILKQSPLDKGT